MGQQQRRGHQRLRNAFGSSHRFCRLAVTFAIHVWSRPLGMLISCSDADVEDVGRMADVGKWDDTTAILGMVRWWRLAHAKMHSDMQS